MQPYHTYFFINSGWAFRQKKKKKKNLTLTNGENLENQSCKKNQEQPINYILAKYDICS